MNFQPLVTRKDLAETLHVSVDTVREKYGRMLEPARCRATIKPVTYFEDRANRILLKAGALAQEGV